MPFFRRPEYDVVVVAARFEKPGKIAWVRAFERRGPTWSDRRMIQREDLIERIRAGERFVTGERIQFEAGSFKTGETIRVEDHNGAALLLAGSGNGSVDSLDGVPVV